jgi:L-lactate dehydrogenase complex protein LldG
MADFAIAETGTFVVNSVDEKIRLATSLSEHLFLVVKKSNIVSSLEDIANYMNSECSKENSYIAFISGASRTADIERVLTIGVHGPVALTAIILSDL